MAEKRAEHFFRNIQFFADSEVKISPKPNDDRFKQFRSPDINKRGSLLYLLAHWSSNMADGIGIDAKSLALGLTSDGIIQGTVGELAGKERQFYRLEMRIRSGISADESRVVSVGLQVDGWGKTFSFIYHPDKGQVPGPLAIESWKRVVALSQGAVYLMVSPEDPAILVKLRGSLRISRPPVPKVHIL